MPLFELRAEVVAVVEAEDEGHAMDIAAGHWREIATDVMYPMRCVGEIRSVNDLPDDWDELCLPYGGDGNTRIGEILGQS